MANGTIAFDTLSTSGQISGTAVSVDADYLAYGSAKVWILFPGDAASISDSFNVTSLTDSAAGRHIITIANDMNSVHYSYTGMARQDGSDDRAIIVSQEEDSGTAAGSLPFTTQNDGGSYVDTAGIGITIHGDLA